MNIITYFFIILVVVIQFPAVNFQSLFDKFILNFTKKSNAIRILAENENIDVDKLQHIISDEIH